MAVDTLIGFPDQRVVRNELGSLCTRGVIPWWVRDHGEALLSLGCVSERIAASEGRIDPVEALTEILRELVSRINHSHGTILWIVLGLDEAYLELTADERRALAGLEFRGGADPVSAGTIRQHHEPRALDRLTVILLDYERQYH